MRDIVTKQRRLSLAGRKPRISPACLLTRDTDPGTQTHARCESHSATIKHVSGRWQCVCMFTRTLYLCLSLSCLGTIL